MSNVLTYDVRLLFLTRFTRLFAYGALSVVLVLYLTSLGLSEPQTGMLLTLTLVGDTFVSLFLTTRADRIGRRACSSLAPFSWLALVWPSHLQAVFCS